MNYQFLSLEIAVVLLGLGVLLVDLWTPAEHKRVPRLYRWRRSGSGFDLDRQL